MPLNEAELRTLLYGAVVTLHNKISQEFERYRPEISYLPPPKEVQHLLNCTTALQQQLDRPAEELPEHLLPWLKRAVLDARLDLANRLDLSRAKVSNPAIMEDLDKQLLPYNEIMGHDWFNRTEAARVPQMTDFLTVERAEFHLRAEGLQERQYDEKFHVLQAPTLFLPDLDYYRKKCAMRNVPLLVAYMDIDKFKEFNAQHGETHVDLHVLPRFMATLESHVYARGFAYRFGGDEYAVLLPNTDAQAGVVIVKSFQRRLQQIRYRGIDQKTTVSVGCCEVRPDCHFTNGELLRFAESAKNFAKENGRDRVAAFSDRLYKELCVINGESKRD